MIATKKTVIDYLKENEQNLIIHHINGVRLRRDDVQSFIIDGKFNNNPVEIRLEERLFKGCDEGIHRDIIGLCEFIENFPCSSMVFNISVDRIPEDREIFHPQIFAPPIFTQVTDITMYMEN